MKISNETKVGILAIVAIFVFVWGYNFLKGKDIFQAQRFVYVEYDKVEGLDKSANVLINGFGVGFVSDIYLKEDGSGKIMAVISLDKGVNIPKSTIATIQSPDPLSGKVIALKFKGPCLENNCVASGDTLRGEVMGLIQSMVGDVSVEEYVEKAKEAINSGIDSIMAKFGSGEGNDIKESLADLKSTIKNLNSLTGRLDNLMAKSSDNLVAILDNVTGLTNTLKANSAQIDEIVTNAAEFSAKLNNMDMDKTMDNANAAIDNLQETMKKADVTLASVKELLDKLNYGEGTAALILNDPKVYNNLNNAVRDLDFLLKDFRLNPKRYVNVSVFGKKHKEYEGVEDDPEGIQKGKNPKKKELNKDPNQ